ncbi:hypothetical protein EON82_24355, partial [bacterium]
MEHTLGAPEKRRFGREGSEHDLTIQVLNACDECIQAIPVELCGRVVEQQRGETALPLTEALQEGPHRADIALRLGKASAKDVLSRGQQKLAAAALVLSLLQG